MAKSKLAASAEVFGAMLSAGVEDKAAIAEDPKGYISRAAHVELQDHLDINVVANDGRTVNLALPYYSVLEDSKPQIIDESDLQAVAGGGGMSMDIAYGGVQNYVMHKMYHHEGSRIVSHEQNNIASQAHRLTQSQSQSQSESQGK